MQMMMASVSQQHLYSVVKCFVLVVTGPVYFLFDGYAPIVAIVAVALTQFCSVLWLNSKRGTSTMHIHSIGNGFSSSHDSNISRQIRILCLLRNSSRFIVLGYVAVLLSLLRFVFSVLILFCF